MTLGLLDTLPDQIKTPEMYKKLLLEEFGIELDIDKARSYGDKIRGYISHNPDNEGIAYAIRKSREITVITTLYYADRITAKILKSNPSSLFILNIWTTSPEDTLQSVKGASIPTQKAARLSDFFRKDENKYALATILGLVLPNSGRIIADTEKQTADTLGQ